MWTRSLLKMNAKQVLSRNYWMALLVCFVASLLGGGTQPASPRLTYQFTSHSGRYSYHDYSYSVVPFLNGIIASLFTGVALLMALAGILLTVFIGTALCVGKCRYFMESRVGDAPFSTLFSTFGPAYWNVVKVMFLKDLFIGLWSLLLVIPGIYKAYQYRMVDYLLAENPYLSYDRALELSRQMTEGEKFNMFILDLSFFGWLFLGTMVFTIGIYFVNPYIEATYAELYAALRAKAFSLGITGEDELSGFIRY